MDKKEYQVWSGISCIMGNVVFNTVILDSQNQYCWISDITFFILHILFPFPNLVPTLPIMQLSH